MKLNLSNNIRKLRKSKNLTQEQLAEVFDVTVGAVYKWESGLSVPDISLIIEIADFFDMSIDVLLGYEMKDNHQKAIVKRLDEYLHTKNSDGLIESKKALKKYPHDFNILYKSAVIHQMFGLENNDKEMMEYAIELFKESLPLLSQNNDSKISEIGILGSIAQTYLALEKNKEVIEILKNNNPSGLYDRLIGLALATDGRMEEALSTLSDALIHSLASICYIISGYMTVYFKTDNYADAKSLLNWVITMLTELNYSNKISFLYQANCIFYTWLSYSNFKLGENETSVASLKNGISLAEQFDKFPTYNVNTIKFINKNYDAMAFFDIGTSAIDGIKYSISDFEDEAFSKFVKAHFTDLK